MVVQKHKSKIYISVSANYEDFHKFSMLVTETSIHLEQLHFSSVVPSVNATDAYNKLAATSSVSSAMDQFVSFFDVEEVRKSWVSLNLLTNGTFIPQN